MPTQQVHLNLFYLETSDAFLDIETDMAIGIKTAHASKQLLCNQHTKFFFIEINVSDCI